MISFGELRAKSVEWRIEISTVEKIYALRWLVKGLFDRPALAAALALTDASALNLVYFPDYPQVETLDLARAPELRNEQLETELVQAVADAARESGLQFRLHSLQPTEARFEFTGPLGRRSAAQPTLVVRFLGSPVHAPPEMHPLLYPFRDTCAAEVRAVTLAELAAVRVLLFSGKPRARDVFDLWFILTHAAPEQLPSNAVRHMVAAISAEKQGTGSQISPRAELDPAYAPLLERAWENALKSIPHPPFATALAETQSALGALL